MIPSSALRGVLVVVLAAGFSAAAHGAVDRDDTHRVERDFQTTGKSEMLEIFKREQRQAEEGQRLGVRLGQCLEQLKDARLQSSPHIDRLLAPQVRRVAPRVRFAAFSLPLD